MEFLNSRPLRFPWIGWTEDLFWDEGDEKCERKLVFGRLWEREPLAGLSVSKAYLQGIVLCSSNLRGAELKNADLYGANLKDASL